VPQLRHGLSARGLLRLTYDPKIDLSRDPLPPPLRQGGGLTVLDITEYFGQETGGIRTYLTAKTKWAATTEQYRQILVHSSAWDTLHDGTGFRSYGLGGPRIPFNPQYRLLLSTRTPRRIIEHEYPDLIEVGSHLLVPWVTRIANRHAKVPVVWFYHGHLPRLVAPDHRAGPLQRLLERGSWAYVRRIAAGCRAVLVASRYLERELAEHGVTNIVRVPLGVDLEHFRPDRRARASYLRGRLGVPEGRIALFAGRFAREKRLDIVLDAWGEIERRTGVRLVMVGGGPGESGLRRHPYASRVTWLPFERNREVLADLLAAVDLYVAPGPYETFGLSAIEAMASGVPVLSVDRGGVAERVQESGAGATYPFDDVDGLVESATALLAGDLPALGARGRAFVERHHSWEVACGAIFETYRRILDR
jgi:alpha-1,6-mannosyltransferase